MFKQIGVLFIGLLSLWCVECLPQICSGNRYNTLRGCDGNGLGCGGFGVSRAGGSRTHAGVDIACSGGASVYSPCTGRVVRASRPYSSGKCSGTPANSGALIRCNDGEEYKMWYFKLSKSAGSSVSQGDKIGEVVSLDKHCYPGITDHVHIQNKYKTNPIG